MDEIKELDLEIKKLQGEMAPIHKKIREASLKRQSLIEKYYLNIDPTAKIIAEFDKWPDCGVTIHTKFVRWIHQNYNKKGISFRGTGMNMLHLYVAMDQNLPFEDQLGILDFWPYLQPQKYAGGSTVKDVKIVHCDILENGLGDDDYYTLITDVERTTFKVVGFMGKVYIETPILRVALRYIYDNLPYIKKGQ